MSSASVSGGASAGRRPLVITLAIIGILAIILGVLYLAGGSALPSFLLNSVHGKPVHTGHHVARAAVALVVGVLLLIGAWFAGKSSSRAGAA